MANYDSPYCNATLDHWAYERDALYDAISADEARGRVMSAAAYEAVENVVTDWLRRPHAVWCQYNIDDEDISVFIDGPKAGDGYIACYKLPLADLLLSAAQSAEDWYGLPPERIAATLRKLADQMPETVSAALRKLADQIDNKE